MRHSITLLVLFVCISTAIAGAVDTKDAKAISLADSAWSTPLIGFGMKGNDAYTDGHVFLTLPVWSSIGANGRLGGDYVFIEPYTSLGENGETASSLGISWRHFFNDQPVSALDSRKQAAFMEEGLYIGASLFVDMLNTQHDNKFWQLGIGAEIGTRYLELRGNYYIPLTDREIVQRTETTQTLTSSSTKLTTVGSASATGNGAPFATVNQIVQDFGTQTTFATTTTRTTTIRTVTEIFEEGMEGWDAELAVLIPRLDQWLDVRLLGGYFSFDNQPFGPQEFGTGNVHGFKVGIEVRPVPAVLLTAMWYEDERFTGADWTMGVQFQIPLGREWKDAFRPRRRHLVERLAEPVRRQNDAIKIGNDEEQTQTTQTSVAKVTRIVSQSPGRIVLVDDVIFVNNGSAVGNGIAAGPAVVGGGDGTAENPKGEVDEGAAIAVANSGTTGRVWNVYTQGGSGAYIVPPNSLGSLKVEVTESTNFISSATIIQAPDGQTFGTGDRPLVNGGFDVRKNLGASIIESFGIRDHDIAASTEGPAIIVTNVRSAIIFNNDISNGGDRGVDVSASDIGLVATTSTVIFSSNTLHDIGLDSGLELFAGGSSTLDMTFDGNTIFNIPSHGVNANRFTLGGTPILNFNGKINNIFNSGSIGGNNYNQSNPFSIPPNGNFLLNGNPVPVSSGVDQP